MQDHCVERPHGSLRNVSFTQDTFALAKTMGRTSVLTIVGRGDTGLAVNMAGQAKNEI